MFVGASLASLANLLCQLVVVRRFTIADYGVFNSLVSFFAIISLPMASVGTMVAKFTASYNNLGEREKTDFFILTLLKHMFFIAALFLIVYLLFGFGFKNYLHLDSVLPIYIIGFMLPLTIISTVAVGAIQGLEKFIWLSLSNIIGSASKLILVFLFILLGWGLLGALWAFLLSQALALIVSFFPLSHIFYLKETRLDINLKEKYKFIIPSFIALACMAVLTNTDVVLVKHFFKPIEAGYYSVAQLIGKIVLFIPGAVYIVMLPAASGLHAREKDSRVILKKGLIYTAFLCISIAALYNIIPDIILGILAGKAGQEIIFLGRLFSVAMTFFSLLTTLLLYQLSVSRFGFLKWLALFSLLQILAILIFHATLSQILFILISNSAILFLLNLRSALKS